MVTRNDVARHAGVSVAVVSYVLNNKSIVKEETRLRVLRAMEELNYQPNLTARSLKTKRSGQLGVLTNFIGNPFEAGILLHLEEAARQYGYMITYHTYRDEHAEVLKAQLAGRVDGIILLGQSLPDDLLDTFNKRNIPLVSIMKPAHLEIPLTYVDVDWQAAYGKIFRLLKQQGHSEIALMSHGNSLNPLQARMASAIHLLETDESFRHMKYQVLEGRGRYENAYHAIMQLSEPHFTAILCANDLMAIGTIAACRDKGWRVPNELAVIGSENILMVGETNPPIAAVEYPRIQAANMAVEKLIQLIGGHHGDVESDLIQADFISRPSLGRDQE
ncbi:LacI family DNA-binding transcriptional regulator [Paenibacillus qinlingensis]|uniref:DNA-binding LacI/PurR family transcriptional regulator n=1 Tax=Paenibacillus qinlingensis TaxID=1837343 RepID=A0ABU1NTH0_9BACL|nr:LacI family DNA-binding transcriptional regulator [Paenibacillus qinlingensis]MDR6550785.1 DNA-binding LacI/PurR family transcriptional regulator [Paenibacillus qinlingensis]